MTVFDREGRSIADSSGAPLPLDVVAGQTYFIQVSGTRGATGGYELSLEAIADRFAQAQRITLDSDGSALELGIITTAGQAEMFQFVASVTGKLTVGQIPSSGSVLNGSITIFGSVGNIVTSSDGQGVLPDAAVSFDVVRGQTFFIRFGALGSSTGAFLLNISTDQVAPPEIGDSLSNPQMLVPSFGGPLPSVSGDIKTPASSLVYQIDVPAETNEFLIVRVSPQPGSQLDPTIELYDSSMRLQSTNRDVAPAMTPYQTEAFSIAFYLALKFPPVAGSFLIFTVHLPGKHYRRPGEWLRGNYRPILDCDLPRKHCRRWRRLRQITHFHLPNNS